MMKKAWALLAALALLSAPAAARDKSFSRTIEIAPGSTLSLDTYKGSIHLSSWERSQVEIVATIEAGGNVSAEYAERSVEATEIRVRESGSGVYIKSDYDDVPYEKGWLWGRSRTLPYVHYQIRAPRSLRLEVDDYKSEIEAYGFEGRIEIETYKGNLDANDLAGDIRIETYKGRADLRGVRGSLDIETYKGDVIAEVSRLDRDCRLDTYKGNITLQLASDQGLDIDADLSRKASFRSDFDIARRSRDDHDFRASVNGGGPRLRVKSYKGDIRLERR